MVLALKSLPLALICQAEISTFWTIIYFSLAPLLCCRPNSDSLFPVIQCNSFQTRQGTKWKSSDWVINLIGKNNNKKEEIKQTTTISLLRQDANLSLIHLWWWFLSGVFLASPVLLGKVIWAQKWLWFWISKYNLQCRVINLRVCCKI